MVLNTLNWPGYSLFDVNDTDSSVIACNRSTRLNIANETTFHKALREIFDKGVARACTRSDRLILFVVEAIRFCTGQAMGIPAKQVRRLRLPRCDDRPTGPKPLRAG